MNKKEILKKLELTNCRSAWSKGVKEYAIELVENLDNNVLYSKSNLCDLRRDLLNGASDATAYSYGGSAFIYDCDIALRLCNPSELKRTKEGSLNPNRNETWLDVQARAIKQAIDMVQRVVKYASV